MEKKSFVDELFPRREAALQTKSDILSSIFPPRPTVAGNLSSHLERTLAGRKQGADEQISSVNTHGSSSRNHNMVKRNGNPVYLWELPESCLMSSSVFYGGRDDFIPDPSYAHHSARPYAHKRDYKEDDSSSSDVASTGDWWQGSVYY
ncbi:hypothetical protein HPP92_018174 [Vanilla planifolia]|uniref:Uncharacterized protein n=1 Tax=Vanilla planifolia TaxID=51239 RepID=A0A835Q6K4_VANPL|nr:hypothetical protein HPP92_018174 [Vanilla planifolia]